MVPSNQGLFKLDSTLEMAWYKPRLYKCQTEAIEKRLASGHMKGSGKASLPVLMSLSGPFCYSKVTVYMDKSWTWGNVECVQVWQDGTWRILEFGRKWGKRGKTVKRGSQKAGKGTGQRLGIPGNEVCPAHKFPKALQYCLLIFLIHFTREREMLSNWPCSPGVRKCICCERNLYLEPGHLLFCGSSDSIICQIPFCPYATQNVHAHSHKYLYPLTLTPQCPDRQLPIHKAIWSAYIKNKNILKWQPTKNSQKSKPKKWVCNGRSKDHDTC